MKSQLFAFSSSGQFPTGCVHISRLVLAGRQACRRRCPAVLKTKSPVFATLTPECRSRPRGHRICPPSTAAESLVCRSSQCHVMISQGPSPSGHPEAGHGPPSPLQLSCSFSRQRKSFFLFCRLPITDFLGRAQSLCHRGSASPSSSVLVCHQNRSG